ncbi:PREDICTED: vacuolar protein sorting-associated protein 27 [Tarenaya hassleriana]|uniref:vacuolar protein sorting-associated protein 27 n=1 Tax=Tarenaya hassleriana TaxID=28532 RepID=UPI00053C92D7|nr:PREDICTED: vacuolar protein sorting-associated protein 27 [Tarenaya hassleriana]
MALEPPAFQEAARCDVCKCSFNTFRRRHHCRCCGRTLCHEHSSNQMALPQFGLNLPVRVCADCFNNSARSVKTNIHASADEVDSVTGGVSRLDIDTDMGFKTNPTLEQHSVVAVAECKCGMPLCICVAPAPPANTLIPETTPASVAPIQPNLKPRRTEASARIKGSTSNSITSSASNPGQLTSSAMDIPQRDYECNGEGLREAIKNGDAAGVGKLLKEGVDANYRDKQGMSVLHLAAMFNCTDITFILMEHGASLEHKNAQGETPIDCAPATLQYKMRQKMEEIGKSFGS